MVTEMNIGQFKSWINNAPPEDLLTIAPVLFNRIGNLDQSYQDRVIQEVQLNPQAKRVFEKLQAF